MVSILASKRGRSYLLASITGRPWLVASIRGFGASGSGFGVTDGKSDEVVKTVYKFSFKHGGAIPIINTVPYSNKERNKCFKDRAGLVTKTESNGGVFSCNLGDAPAKNGIHHSRDHGTFGSNIDNESEVRSDMIWENTVPNSKKEVSPIPIDVESLDLQTPDVQNAIGQSLGQSFAIENNFNLANINDPVEYVENCIAPIEGIQYIIPQTEDIQGNIATKAPIEGIHSITAQTEDNQVNIATEAVQSIISQTQGVQSIIAPTQSIKYLIAPTEEELLCMSQEKEVYEVAFPIENENYTIGTSLTPLKTFDNCEDFNNFLKNDIVTVLNLDNSGDMVTALNVEHDGYHDWATEDIASASFSLSESDTSKFLPSYDYTNSPSFLTPLDYPLVNISGRSPPQKELHSTETALLHNNNAKSKREQSNSSMQPNKWITAKKTTVPTLEAKASRNEIIKTKKKPEAPKKAAKRTSEDDYNKDRCKRYRDNKKKKLETTKTELEVEEERNGMLKQKEDSLRSKITILQKYLLFAIKNNQFKCEKM